MKSNNYKDNFFTALKNGKFGIFREQTSLEEIRRYLPGLEAGHTESFYYEDRLEIYFDAHLRRIKLDLEDSRSGKHNLKYLNHLQMSWVEYLLACTYTSLHNDIKESGIQCLCLEDDLGHKIFSICKHSNTLSIYFCEDELTLLVIEFEDEFRCVRGFRRMERLN